MKKAFFIFILLIVVWVMACNRMDDGNGKSTAEIHARIARVENAVWNLGKVDALDELYHPDCLLHVPPFPESKGVDGLKMIINGFHQEIPGVKFRIDELFITGDRAVERYTWQGIHKKTGKKVLVSGSVVYHLSGDKVIEAWNFEDMLGFYQQLGWISSGPPENDR